MNLITALNLLGAEGFTFIGEEGADIRLDSNSVTEIKLKNEYNIETFYSGMNSLGEKKDGGVNQLSGKIIELSQEGVRLESVEGKYHIPYSKINELRITGRRC
jgi:hypothetical protein